MTKEEYFATPWHYEDCAIRTVDSNGTLTYRHSTPEIQGGYWESFNRCEICFFTRDDVADWWRESLQTHEEFLQLKNQTND